VVPQPPPPPIPKGFTPDQAENAIVIQTRVKTAIENNEEFFEIILPKPYHNRDPLPQVIRVNDTLYYEECEHRLSDGGEGWIKYRITSAPIHQPALRLKRRK
jgi:hypothetical protein